MGWRWRRFGWCSAPAGSKVPPLRMGLFVGVFYEIALSLGQFLVAAWLGVLFRDTAFLHTASPQGQAALWLLHALL